MSEVGTKEWKVLDFRVGKTEPNPHGGQFQKFYVDFEGSPDTYWRRREGDEPEKGRSYYGTITEGNYGPMFKKEKPPEGSTGSSGGSKNYSKEWTPEAQRDPERAARILRQHSQSAAIDAIKASGIIAPNTDAFREQIKQWTDFFDQDVIAAGQKAAQAGGESTGNGSNGTTSQRPAPGAQETQSNAEYLSKLLEEAGFDLAQVTVVQRYIETNFDNERRTKVEAALKDITRAPKAYDQLKQETEAWTGEALPVNDPASTEIDF